VVDFADDVISLSDDVKNDPGCEARCTAVAVTDLNFKASLLAFAFKMKPPGPRLKSATYRDIAASGNWLVKLATLRGAKFMSVSCHGMVDDTVECTAARVTSARAPARRSCWRGAPRGLLGGLGTILVDVQAYAWYAATVLWFYP
jgi:hypothetical protein